MLKIKICFNGKQKNQDPQSENPSERPGNRTVNKGAGIRIIQKRYHISREESMALGDYMNDYAMLRECAESYAMGNACAEIKRIAAHETATNDEDGVMKILREF